MSTLPILTNKIAEKISQSGGKIPFSDYMKMALYYPKLGYYTKHSNPFGRQGDFTTAPEISDLFGKCIARSVEPVLAHCQKSSILEIGAGTGKLAKVLLDNLSHKIKIEKYFIFEINPVLQKLQKNTLKKHIQQHSDQIIWIKNLRELHQFEGLILANEIIDAFPVTRFCWQNNQAYPYYVINQKHKNNTNQFDWHLDKSGLNSYPDKNLNFIHQLNLPDNYTSEFHPGLKSFIKNLSKILSQGLILLIDYGFPEREFYHPDRVDGTLMCHYQHTAHTDPFYLPGLQDITAHVNFTAVAEAAVKANLEVCGYTSQAGFLLETGITDFCQAYQDTQAIKLLTLPHEMGELFKVMALSPCSASQHSRTAIGFALNDRRHCL